MFASNSGADWSWKTSNLKSTREQVSCIPSQTQGIRVAKMHSNDLMSYLMPQASPAAGNISCLPPLHSFFFPSNKRPVYINRVGEEREGNLVLKIVSAREATENSVWRISYKDCSSRLLCLPASSAFSPHQSIPVTSQEIAASLKHI